MWYVSVVVSNCHTVLSRLPNPVKGLRITLTIGTFRDFVLTSAVGLDMRTTVLPTGIAAGSVHPHHITIRQQLEFLVAPLLLLHLFAFAYWVYLLYLSRRRPAINDTVPRAMEAWRTPREILNVETWRTPREILNTYQKTRLGKD